ncbi:YceI family protein [Humibacter sp. RRB41]|uniref:YceI family protein n=1 Tax=Humibacter sp. RRB41 TaxID=2919946 RepID=UPI001FAA8513|nr:YceI family protein [Humibacter sp. RRB41]
MRTPTGQQSAPGNITSRAADVPAVVRTTDTAPLLARGATGHWDLDAAVSSVRFTTGLLGGLVPVRGGFRDVDGHVEIGANGDVTGGMAALAVSVDTHNARRDRHLRSAAFFDVENSPRIEFAVDGIQPSHRGVAVTGMLTVRDISREFTVEMSGSLLGEAEVCLDGVVTLDRREIGITWNALGMASAVVTVAVHAVFRRRE